MTKNDGPKFLELMFALAATFNREADEAFLHGYSMALDDLPIERIESAARRATKECKFMPTGSELREFCGDVRDTDRSVIAFDALSKAVKDHGYYESVTFDDPIINATVHNLGGWERICLIENQEEWEKWFRKEFDRVYLSLCRTGVSAEMCKPLIGLYDQSNGFNGYHENVKQPWQSTDTEP